MQAAAFFAGSLFRSAPSSLRPSSRAPSSQRPSSQAPSWLRPSCGRVATFFGSGFLRGRLLRRDLLRCNLLRRYLLCRSFLGCHFLCCNLLRRDLLSCYFLCRDLLYRSSFLSRSSLLCCESFLAAGFLLAGYVLAFFASYFFAIIFSFRFSDESQFKLHPSSKPASRGRFSGRALRSGLFIGVRRCCAAYANECGKARRAKRHRAPDLFGVESSTPAIVCLIEPPATTPAAFFRGEVCPSH